MKDYKNILVIRTDRMGDVVLTTPVFKPLKEFFPQAKISVLIAPSTKDLVKGNPYVDHIIVDDRLGEHKGGLGFFKLVGELKKKKFDLAIVYHTKKRINALCFLAGIPERMGYRNDKFGFLLNRPIKDERHIGDKHEARYCLDVLTHLGMQVEKINPCVPIQPDAQRWVKDKFKEYQLNDNIPIVALHAGASDPSKVWPAKHFAKLMDMIYQERKVHFLMVGDKNLKKTIEEIKLLTKTPFIDLSGSTTIGQFACLLKNCKMLISSDSGPVHLASGVNIPVVAIFTRNQPGINFERWRPLSRGSKVVSIEPNMEVSFKKAEPVDPKYLELIQPQQVFEAVDAIFKL